MVIRCANLVPVFFDTYRNILYQSDISGQDAQSASIPRMFFPVGWKRQPEEGGIPQQHPPLKTSKTPPTASTPGAMPPSSGVPQQHPPTKSQKAPPTASTPRPMPPSSGVPRPHPPNETSNVSPPASNAKSRRQKISRTDMRLRHSLSLAFRKKIKCIILIDKRIKTSASVYSKYHTKGGFYHGIQTFWKHDLSSS